MKRIVLSIFGILIVLIIVAVMVAALNLDRIVKKSVEAYGPQITKVPITLDAVHIGLLTGSASVKGLVVGNPPGYKMPQAISIGEASVGVNPLSILSDKIIVRSIVVKSPEITFEGGLSGNNLSTIKNNMNSTAQTGGPTVTNSVGKPKPAKKLEVDDFLITGAKVNGTLKLFSGGEVPVPNLTLPDIHLTNLGTGPDGITAADLSRRVMDAITAKTMQEIGKYAENTGKGAINLGTTNLNGLKKTIGNLFK